MDLRESGLFKDYVLSHLKPLSVKEYNRERKLPYIVFEAEGGKNKLFLEPSVEILEEDGFTLMKLGIKAQIGRGFSSKFQNYIASGDKQEAFLDSLLERGSLRVKKKVAKIKREIGKGHIKRLEPKIEEENIVIGCSFNGTIIDGIKRRHMAYDYLVRFVLEAFLMGK